MGQPTWYGINAYTRRRWERETFTSKPQTRFDLRKQTWLAYSTHILAFLPLSLQTPGARVERLCLAEKDHICQLFVIKDKYWLYASMLGFDGQGNMGQEVAEANLQQPSQRTSWIAIKRTIPMLTDRDKITPKSPFLCTYEKRQPPVTIISNTFLNSANKMGWYNKKEQTM